MILDFQTNKCFFSRRLIDEPGVEGPDIIKIISSTGIDIDFIDNTRDIWARDFMPVQVGDDVFIGYEYAPDYLYNDSFARTITSQVRVCDVMDFNFIPSGIILDGGNVVKTSKGIIMTEKVFHENDRFSKLGLTRKLEDLFQSEIIFLPWDRAEIFGHADGIAREISPGRLLITDYHRYSKRFAEKFLGILSAIFDVEMLSFDVERQHKDSWCYINFLQVGDKVFLPQLTPSYTMPVDAVPYTNPRYTVNTVGKTVAEDAQALETFRRLMDDCEIIPVACPKLVAQGGALNCISWNIKS